MEMRRLTICLLAVFAALFTMAPAPDKAEKLRYEDTDWDRDVQQFVIKMSCKFGIATAGEHANFTTQTELTIVAGGKTYTLEATNGIAKVAGATKDEDNYVPIEPTTITWDRAGGTFEGNATVTASVSLVSPSGNVQGDAVVATQTVKIEPPGGIPCEVCPPPGS
jgi:hypothetical protein